MNAIGQGMPGMTSNERRHFSIFLTNGLSLLSFTSLTAPLRIANEVLGYKAYSWEIVTQDGGAVQTSCGLHLGADCNLDQVRQARSVGRSRFMVLLPSDGSFGFSTRLIAWVRDSVARGIPVMGVGQGALTLAEHGLLDGRRCAVHWTMFAPSVENFPSVVFSRAFFEIDGLIHTCAGEAAAFDLILEIVKQDFGQELRELINQIALQGRARTRADRQAMSLHMRLERLCSPLLPVVKLMESTVAEPLSMEALAESSGVSRRHLERLFQQHLGMPPRRFYRQLRIERAHALLENSLIPLVDVAIASGFVSQSHFAKVYKGFMGCTPQETRAGRRRDGGSVSTFRERSFASSLAA